MSRKSVLVLLFVIIFVSLQHTGFQQNRVEASDDYPVHNLNTDLNYTSIQEAIDASETMNGHTILVDAGTYYGQIILNKSLNLIGQNKETTIIDANGTGKVIIVMVDNTSVSNFTIQGGSWTPYEIYSAIYVNSSNNIIANNILRNNRDYAVFLDSSRKNTIENNVMTSNWRNCMLKDSTENKLIGNKILDGGQECITLWNSSNNRIDSNLLSGGNCGVELSEAYDNVIIGNVINHTIYGIELYSSYQNSIYHNNFINKWRALAYLFSYPGSNYFDSNLEGNYWDDYNGTDSDHDGLGDTPYVIDENNTDHYPLMGTFQSFNVSITPQSFGEVDVISNFTISDLGLYEWLTTPNQYIQAGQPFLRLIPAQKQNKTAGFCRIFIPNSILKTSDYIVLVDMQNVTVKKMYGLGSASTWLYFTFNNPVRDSIMIVAGSSSSSSPVYPLSPVTAAIIVALFVVITLLAVIVYKRRHRDRAP